MSGMANGYRFSRYGCGTREEKGMRDSINHEVEMAFHFER